MPADLEQSASIFSWAMTGFVLILVFIAAAAILPGCSAIPAQHHNEDYHGDALRIPRGIEEEMERIRIERLEREAWEDFRKMSTF